MTDEWLLLTTCENNAEASILRSKLEFEGIDCFVQGEHHRSLLGFLGPYIELRVLVPRADFHRAQEVLLAKDSPEEPLALETDPP